ncbi:Sec39 domain-containing protein [Lasiosphaeria hispida]|uniref:Sec39 domain-containing protein n=1 Tax=Lasiosphaeria hispida TaxID=260671 RepID=A0AAJ0MHK5_9PEZI|nr:Sec39 domain-containing protein [Lasiosphaeria hispida]
MALLLSPAKLVLLAVHFTVKADVDSLTCLAARHGTILRKELLLRILLTYLPEALQSNKYVGFVEQLENGTFPETGAREVDCSTVEGLTEEDATKKVRKLRLLSLALPEVPEEVSEDATALFLLRRSYKVDEEAGLLDELPSLLLPFLDYSPYIRTLMVSTILPLLRRNCEYYPQEPIPYSLLGFQQLPDRLAVNLLLSQTGLRETELHLVGRDLKGLVGPWLFDEARWKDNDKTNPSDTQDSGTNDATDGSVCPGWEQFLKWLTTHAAKTWRVAVSAIEQWDGPGDIDLGGWGAMWLSGEEQGHLEQRYARAALASAYLIPEGSTQALEGAYSIVAKIASLLDQDPVPPLSSALAILPPLAGQVTDIVSSARNATLMRNDLLDDSNFLTKPKTSSIAFLQGLVLSATLLAKAGSPCTLRRAGELVLLRDEREQKIEATKLIHALGNSGPKTDDRFWIKARNEILWLRDWGAEDAPPVSEHPTRGIFSQIKKEFLEIEILKALLANTRYTLARTIYEDPPDQPLARQLLQDTIYATAMTAYDNASNPNRTRGGLKKCDDIIKSFPKTIEKSAPATRKIEALLQATHALSEYRLVLKQGEPFTPVVLRVHTDPISIIDKILEQNPKSYTKIQNLISLGTGMVQAGLTLRDKHGNAKTLTEEEQERQCLTAERRITAMCIDTALTEDDFETAYSYVVNHLSTLSTTNSEADEYSWKAALQAGKYRCTARTLRPTHLGNTSGNPEIRHLEQRIECLSTALRIAPAPTLQEIINAFRRAEEELEAAIKAEDEQEDAWDTAGDTIIHSGNMPGGFNSSTTAFEHRHSTSAKPAASSRRHQVEEAPMSLFDLSKASVMSAQRNLTALSSLQRSTGLSRSDTVTSNASTAERGIGSDGEDGAQNQAKRARKRDQLREAAMGTLVSGVGWLVGAPAPVAERD